MERRGELKIILEERERWTIKLVQNEIEQDTPVMF